MATKIPWCEETWNPITGCTPISAGCKNCYAAGIAKRFWATQYQNIIVDHRKARPRRFSDVQFHPERLEKRPGTPLYWKKPRHIFVCSMGDLFHDDVKLNWIYDIANIITACPQHKFLLLTKRPDRMAQIIKAVIPNVWLGVTVEKMKYFHPRVGALAEIPAAVKFISLEPLLEPIDFDGTALNILDWVIVGCESGPHRRECKFEWVRSIVQQCDDAGVPVFVKQLSINGKVSHDPKDWPAQLRRREKPNANTLVSG